MKNLHLFFILLILALLLSCSQRSGKDRLPETPNILFIAVDDLRPELGCYGVDRIHSPNIDRLAAGGTMFERAYCNIPVCGASRASLMTGLRPARNRFLYYYTRADEDAPGITTLPQHFRENGYYTISNSKVFHHADDAMQSWDEVWTPRSSSHSWRDYALRENILRDTSDRFRGPPYEMAVLPDTAYKDGKTAVKVMNDLHRLSRMDRPFFLAAGFLKPHLPFNAPKKYWDLYDGKVRLPENDRPPENAPPESLHNWGELRAYAGIPPEGPLTDSMAGKLIHGYYACVSYTDAQVGKILDELERLDLEQNTIVILWGDHGWNLREHGLWCKHCNYETSLHAPLILKVPGTEQAGTFPGIVEFVDIYPTLCELAGLELPDHLQGSSLMEMLYDPGAAGDGVAVSQWFDGITTIRDRYFYTEWVDDSDSAYARMLYDHQVDPGENVNISEYPEQAATVERMSSEMRRSRGEHYFAMPARGASSP